MYVQLKKSIHNQEITFFWSLIGTQINKLTTIAQVPNKKLGYNFFIYFVVFKIRMVNIKYHIKKNSSMLPCWS